MSSFAVSLWESIFTPGPTPTLLIATNASFCALQIILLALLIATYSVHFLVLSVLSAGLWWGINWFAHELAIENARQERIKSTRLDKMTNEQVRDGDGEVGGDEGGGEDTETEKELGVETTVSPNQRDGQSVPIQEQRGSSGLDEVVAGRPSRQRATGADSIGEVSGTDSEWEKVDG